MKDFKNIIIEKIAKVTNLPKEKIAELIEVPKDTTNGDFAFPCFALAKEIKKSPNLIALDIKEKLDEANNQDEISEVIAINGFLNFKINKCEIAKEVIKEFIFLAT